MSESSGNPSQPSFQLLATAPFAFLVKGLLDDTEISELLDAAKKSVFAGPGGGYAGSLPMSEESNIVAKLNSSIRSFLDVDLAAWQVHGTESMSSDAHRGLPVGLHVDTNGAPRRFLTLLLYLTTVAEGGSTVFPAAELTNHARLGESCPHTEECDYVLCAAQGLLEAGVTHTRVDVNSAEDANKSDAEVLESCGLSDHCMSVEPVAGNLLVFFTVGDNGTVDARSWHGGQSVQLGEKWTLQNFIEFPTDIPEADYARVARHVRQQAAQRLVK